MNTELAPEQEGAIILVKKLGEMTKTEVESFVAICDDKIKDNSNVVIVCQKLFWKKVRAEAKTHLSKRKSTITRLSKFSIQK